MNVTESFAEYLENSLGLVLGQDLFIGEAPSSNKVQDDIWWITGAGGTRLIDNTTGEALKAYSIDIYKRSRDYRTIYNELHNLEEQINCDGCVQLTGYETVDIKASVLSIDDDLDKEDRKVGLLHTEITVYKTC
jgi:hypothetical protein